MSLLFGALTQDFVNFGTNLAEAKAGNATAQAHLPAIAAAFRHNAAKDSASLTYIGELTCVREF
jgi:ATP-binding cassette subfamily B (MDR/TAP) protein 1